jgi:nuclear factor I
MSSANSPPTSTTPPMGNSSPEGHCHEGTLSPSPPSLGPDMSSVRVSSVVTSPFAVSREYTFSHIHTQPGQLFTYPNMSGMTGVISPTNLSLFTGPSVTRPQSAPRSTPIPRWNTAAPFISLEEEYNMMPLIPGTNPDQGTLIDADGRLY